MKKIIVISIILILIIMAAYFLYPRKISVSFSESERAFGNPFMGYAPMAWYDEVPEDVRLLYAEISWAELEPNEGEYDFEAIEQEYRFNHWRDEGKNLVLRFVCDTPEDYEHIDIPEWLCEKTGDGTAYDTSYGKGYSPDYENPFFIEKYSQAVRALAKRYGGDDFIKYIELGALGHWGEWHVKYSDGIKRLPKKAVRYEYITPWVEGFPNAYILTRRPFAESREYGFGIYNDVTGDAEQTAQWLCWIKQGGEYDQTGEKNGLVPMEDFWIKSPCGGELTSAISMEKMLENDIETTEELIRRSHQTFLGPKIAEASYRNGYDRLLKALGYRLWFSKAEYTSKPFGGISIDILWHNSGSAPFYDNWPAYVYVCGKSGTLIEKVKLSGDIKDVMPGCSKKMSASISSIRSINDIRNYEISVGVENPAHNGECINLAVDGAGNVKNRVVVNY